MSITGRLIAGHDTSLDWHELWMTSEVEYRDRRGLKERHGGRLSHRWLVVGCNNPDCPARVLVDYREVAAVAIDIALDVLPQPEPKTPQQEALIP